MIFIYLPSKVDFLGEFYKYEKLGHYFVIQYSQLKGFSPTNIENELFSTQGKFAPSFTIVKYWMVEFKRDCASAVEDQIR